jgi:hypothetical protein
MRLKSLIVIVVVAIAIAGLAVGARHQGGLHRWMMSIHGR